MPNIRLKDIDMYYELHGQGQPLVLIAGYTCDHTCWTAMLHQLSQYFQVVIFDNRAIAQTKDQNQPFTVETMANDAMGLIQYLGLEKPHILGQSLGGTIVQTIAKNYHAEIGKCIILNSTAKFNMNTLLAMQHVLQIRRDNLPIDLAISAILPWVFASDFLTPKNINLFKNSVLNNPYPQSLSDQERQYHALEKFDSHTWCKEIKSHALVIASEDDLMVPLSECKLLAETIPHAEFISIPGGHSSPIEQPARLSSIITQFLSKDH